MVYTRKVAMNLSRMYAIEGVRKSVTMYGRKVARNYNRNYANKVARN